jgi:hypothetical protein
MARDMVTFRTGHMGYTSRFSGGRGGPGALVLQLELLFARSIKRPFHASVQRPHHADAREHRGASEFRDQHQAFDRGLPFSRVGFFLWKFGRVGAASSNVTSLRPDGSGIGLSKVRFQPWFTALAKHRFLALDEG